MPIVVFIPILQTVAAAVVGTVAARAASDLYDHFKAGTGNDSAESRGAVQER